MTEFRIIFVDVRGVNVEAETQKKAEEIVKNREWEQGMDWDERDIEIESVDEL
jgi:hypothetical protein